MHHFPFDFSPAHLALRTAHQLKVAFVLTMKKSMLLKQARGGLTMEFSNEYAQVLYHQPKKIAKKVP